LKTSGNREFFSPRDANGHGTHTASTAAGTFIDDVSYRGLALGTIRGGAPRARLAIYKVCWNVLGGQCSSADILKAFDEAIHDGVDVLSLSIGSSIPLFSDIDERDGIATGSFHAVAKGITVVCGAANDGPFAQTVQNTAPWILTVAASSMDRALPTPITLGNNKTFLVWSFSYFLDFNHFNQQHGSSLKPLHSKLNCLTVEPMISAQATTLNFHTNLAGPSHIFWKGNWFQKLNLSRGQGTEPQLCRVV
jgi:subtilisin family serine protease